MNITPPHQINKSHPEKEHNFTGFLCDDLEIGTEYFIKPRAGDSVNEDNSGPHTLVSKTADVAVFSPIGRPNQTLSIRCVDIGTEANTVRIITHIVSRRIGFGKRNRRSKSSSNRRSKRGSKSRRRRSKSRRRRSNY